METINNNDNQTVVSDLTDNLDTDDNLGSKIEEIRVKLINDLNKLNADTIKEKCKELNISGLSKLKKPELIQILENEFFKMKTYLNSKSKNELKGMCKGCDIKRVSATKKESLIYQILLYNSNNMIFKIVENEVLNENVVEKQLSAFELLDKQKQEIEFKIKEEMKRKEEEDKRLLDEAEKKKAEEEKKEAKKKKQSIPKNVRVIIWNHYIGEDIIKHKCLCCKKVTISNTNFEVGHVLSEKNGGTHEINNLRPICFACNHSMGSENMIDFVVKFGLYIG